MEDASLHLIADIPQKAIIEHDGKVLVIMNAKRHWQLPGGRLHEGEIAEEGLKREIREELGIEIECGNIFEVFFKKSPAGNNHFFVIYVCKLLSDVSDIEDLDNEAVEIKWVSSAKELRELGKDAIVWPEYIQTLKKYFAAKA